MTLPLLSPMSLLRLFNENVAQIECFAGLDGEFFADLNPFDLIVDRREVADPVECARGQGDERNAALRVRTCRVPVMLAINVGDDRRVARQPCLVLLVPAVWAWAGGHDELELGLML